MRDAGLARTALGALVLAGCAAGAPRAAWNGETAGGAALESDGALVSDPGAEDAALPDREPPRREALPAEPSVADAGPPPPVVLVTDEPPYLPGARPRPRDVSASADDAALARWNRGGFGDVEGPGGAEEKAAHPAPRIKVDVAEVRGRVVEGDVLRLARAKGYWPFRSCYEDGLRRAQRLRGSVKLRLTLASSGAVRDVRKVGADLADDAVVRCVQRAAKRLTLAASERGTPEITLEVSFWPGDEPVRTLAADTAWSAYTGLAALTAALRARWPEVSACYADGIRQHDGLWGRLALRLRIAAAGGVKEAAEIESHFPAPEVTECVKRAYQSASVPSAGQDLVIVYPLRLGQSSAPRGAGP